MKKIILSALCTLCLCGAVSAKDTPSASALLSGMTPPAPPAASQNNTPPLPANGQLPPPPSQTVNQGTAATTISKKAAIKDQVFGSTAADENALRVKDADVTLKQVSIDKMAGDTSSNEDGDFYGMNAAFLATDGANVTLEKSTIDSSANGGNGLFCYGEKTKVTADSVTIQTRSDHSGGIDVTGGGTIIGKNLSIHTKGASSAAIRSDRGGGRIEITKGSFMTDGTGSPAIYSTADIYVKGATLTANASEAAVIEGKNSISLENCTLSGHMAPTRKIGNETIHEENIHTVMLYQSMSGNAEDGEASLTITDGSLTSFAGDMFYITNTHASLSLSKVKLINKDKAGCLLRVAGNSGSRGWGAKGNNGGHAEVTFDKQKAVGNIVADTVSTLSLTLKGNSSLTGIISQIEGDASDTKGTLDVTIEKGSRWTLTGDSNMTTLANHGTIIFNGYTITLADGTVLKG